MHRILVLLVLLWCAPAVALETWPRAPGSEFRALVWNVSRENLFARSEDFLAVLRALDADLLILDEMSGTRRADEVRELLGRLDQPGDAPWQVVYGSSGDNQRAVFALRGELAPVETFRHLPYPPAYLRRANRAELPDWQRERLRANLAAGIGVGAAIAQLGGRELLVVGVDLQCCGDTDDSWEERRRFIEVAQIRAELDRSWRLRRPAAVIVAGDFNAVRGRRIVRAMQGPAGNSRQHLAVARARHADGQTRWTWDGRGTPFPSRALDFVLYSRELVAVSALVFDTETLDPAQRGALGLPSGHMRALSEHRPVVVDFRWK